MGRQFWKLYAAGMTLLMLGAGGVLFLTFYVIHPAPGEPIAQTDLVAGQPFELRYVSNGESQRVFVDIDCEPCSDVEFDGKIAVASAGTPVAQHEIDGRGTYIHTREQRHWREIVHGNLLFSIPEQPRGAEVVLSGSLDTRRRSSITVWPPSASDFGKSKPGLPPTIHAFRIWVAP